MRLDVFYALLVLLGGREFFARAGRGGFLLFLAVLEVQLELDALVQFLLQRLGLGGNFRVFQQEIFGRT